MVKAGKERIRFDFKERKGNGVPYFMFISRDAIQELRKWLAIREKLLEQLGIQNCRWIWITKTGRPLTPKQFHTIFRNTLTRHKLYHGPLSVRTHGFRKFFEQEASPPEIGISKAYI